MGACTFQTVFTQFSSITVTSVLCSLMYQLSIHFVTTEAIWL